MCFTHFSEVPVRFELYRSCVQKQPADPIGAMSYIGVHGHEGGGQAAFASTWSVALSKASCRDAQCDGIALSAGSVQRGI